MTFREARKIRPDIDSVVVKKTGERLVVKDKIVHYPDGLHDGKFVFMICNNNALYSHSEVKAI